jgi:hypothetical protein
MIDWPRLKYQAMEYRRAIVEALAGESARADLIPPTWNNNLRWHAGHLVTTPHLLTYALMGEPLGIPAEYRRWFAKGTSPSVWEGEPVPNLETLVEELVQPLEAIFDDFEDRHDTPYPRPYRTSMGIQLSTPAESLLLNVTHDGLHLGMIQALKRGLNGMERR